MSFAQLADEFGTLLVEEFISNGHPLGAALMDLSDIFEKDWASRTWTIQEIVVAALVNVLCGDWSFTWDSFVTIMALYQRADLHYRTFRLQSETAQLSILQIFVVSSL
jgi:hypothetical protein